MVLSSDALSIFLPSGRKMAAFMLFVWPLNCGGSENDTKFVMQFSTVCYQFSNEPFQMSQRD